MCEGWRIGWYVDDGFTIWMYNLLELGISVWFCVMV